MSKGRVAERCACVRGRAHTRATIPRHGVGRGAQSKMSREVYVPRKLWKLVAFME